MPNSVRQPRVEIREAFLALLKPAAGADPSAMETLERTAGKIALL